MSTAATDGAARARTLARSARSKGPVMSSGRLARLAVPMAVVIVVVMMVVVVVPLPSVVLDVLIALNIAASLIVLLLAAGPLRLPLRRLLRTAIPQLPVIGFSETAGIHQIESVGQVSRDHEFAA
jgi:flagellar biosynthesis component FlhA